MEALEKNTTTRTSHDFREGDLCWMPEWAGAWARHGMAVIQADQSGNLWALDTYWVSWENGGRRLEECRGSLEFIINLNDCKLTDRDTWEHYADCDRAHIPLAEWEPKLEPHITDGACE